MLIRTLTIILITAGLLPGNLRAQGETAVPFLLISPYAEANGMGEASVAVITDDPLASIVNPAHLGMQIGNGRFSVGFNHSDWLPGFDIKNLYYRTYAINAGIALNELLDITPVLTLGAGYSRVHINLGEHTLTSPIGPEPIGTFNHYETSDQFTISAGFDYLIKASAGISFKQIHSKLGTHLTAQEMIGGEARVSSYDYGVLVRIPVIGGMSLIRDEPLRAGESFFPYFDVNFGFAFNNMGDKKVSYIDGEFADPLPRYARIGMGLEAGFEYELDNVTLKPISLTLTREANDILVKRLPPRTWESVVTHPDWEYRSGMGDINFFDEIILGKTNPETIMKTGWELGVLEIVYVRGGRFREAYHRGNRNFTTSGYSVRFGGIAKLLRSTDATPANNGVMEFILNHLDIRYNYSKYSTVEKMHPLDDTVFNAFVLTVSI
jgi:hypothetical protein